MTRRTALARARRGAEFLDTKYKGWRKVIDVETLDLGESFSAGSGGCVLSQLDYRYGHVDAYGYGSYEHRAYKLGLQPWGGKLGRFGFTARGEDDYSTLTKAWKDLLTGKVAS